MIKVGSRVRYIRIDDEHDKMTGFYPPINTCGTVVTVGKDTDIEVKWDCGTKGDGVWWCELSDVEDEEFNIHDFVHDKVNEMFAKYQRKHLISDGDIAPMEAVRLEEIETELASLIVRVCSHQKKTNHYVYRDCDGNEKIVDCSEHSEDRFFTEVSKRICFDDLTDEEVISIWWGGEEVHYVGWQPAMKYEYKNSDGEIIWVAYFEEWDH
jgi:hypothetical protein